MACFLSLSLTPEEDILLTFLMDFLVKINGVVNVEIKCYNVLCYQLLSQIKETFVGLSIKFVHDKLLLGTSFLFLRSIS